VTPTPEQRATRLFPEGTIDHAVQRERVTRAIRAAENAAYDRAANVVRDMMAAHVYDLAPRPNAAAYEARIRKLKTRAPRRRSK
jgi:hypothetical protein